MAKITIVNVETNEIIEREETDEELNERIEIGLREQKRMEQKRKQIENKQAKQTKLLEKLGITEEEAKLLLS